MRIEKEVTKCLEQFLTCSKSLTKHEISSNDVHFQLPACSVYIPSI